MSPSQVALADYPVFIVGSPRSGTTWLLRLLLAHPGIRGGPESHFFDTFGPVVASFDRYLEDGDRDGLGNYWTRDAFLEQIRNLWRQTISPYLDDETRVVIEKTPEHALHMKQTLKVLPAARFIHLIRDSRAVAASVMAAASEEFGKPWAPTSARGAGIFWYRFVRAARDAGRDLPSQQYIEVFYEELMIDPVKQVLRLFDFIGLPAAPEQVTQAVEQHEFERQREIGGTPFVRHGEFAQFSNVSCARQGNLRKGRAEAWKEELSLWQKLVVWRLTRKLMRECGYTWRGRTNFCTTLR